MINVGEASSGIGKAYSEGSGSWLTGYGRGLPLTWVGAGVRKRKGERTRPEGART
jgi:hypothetical protein